MNFDTFEEFVSEFGERPDSHNFMGWFSYDAKEKSAYFHIVQCRKNRTLEVTVDRCKKADFKLWMSGTLKALQEDWGAV